MRVADEGFGWLADYGSARTTRRERVGCIFKKLDPLGQRPRGKIPPARFARRIASFSNVFAAFGPQIPPKIPARFARRIASFSYVLLRLDPNIPDFSRRASRAGLLHFPMVLLLLDCLWVSYIFPMFWAP